MSEPAGNEPVRRGPLRRLLGSIWLRVAVTAGLLAVVAAKVDWSAMGSRVSNGKPVDFALAVVALVLAFGVGAWRWHLLLRAAGIVLGMPRLLHIYAVSSFTNAFLPTTVGGDVTRALMVARRGPLLTRTALTVIVDRAGALVGLIGLAWLAFALDPGAVAAKALTFLAWATVACVAGTLAVGVAVLRGGGALRRLVPARLLASARESHAVLLAYARSPLLLALVLVSSVVFQGLVALQVMLLARAIEVDLPFATAAVALALVTMVTLIPVSIGGFGLREASYVVLLGAASVSTTDATLISVLTVAALFFASLPGAWLLARDGLTPTLEATQS